MNLKSLRFLALALSLPGAAFAIDGTIAFSPTHPSSNDSITVTLAPAVGESNWCAYNFATQGNFVFVFSYAASCPPGFGTTNSIVIGKLPAGAYQVTWGFTDNFFNEPFPTATLTVSASPLRVPTISAVGALLLVCASLWWVCIGTSSLRRSPNYSFKRTAASGCGTIRRRSAAAA
jgi:hypothetical protein